jgi:AraC-like DNA-binding protein
MITFDKQALLSLIRDLYYVIGIRISIFDADYKVVIEYPEEAPDFCSLIRSTPQGLAGCRACDIEACKRAKELKGPHLYQCHAGVTEAITPIYIDGVIIGYSIFAHMLPQEDYHNSIEIICERCKKYGLNKDEICEAAKSIKTYSKDKIMASIRLLDIIASYLWIKRLATWRDKDIARLLHDFIDKNLDKDLSCKTLCSHFYISRTKLYLISQKAFGTGISDYIISRRIEKAKKLLQSEDSSIKNISLSIGIPDYNYFCKVFKKQVGISPSKFRSGNKSKV